MKKRKRCDYCGELKSDVLTGLCGECDGQYATYCNVCKENVSRDQFCRHIFWTENGDVGSGTLSTDWQDVKPWVLEFCDLLPISLVQAIRDGIAKEEFWLFYTCSMLGGFAHVEAHGVPWEYYWLHEHFDQRTLSDESRDGLHWLFTLYEGDTSEANAVTLEWLDEWLASRLRHETIFAFHVSA